MLDLSLPPAPVPPSPKRRIKIMHGHGADSRTLVFEADFGSQPGRVLRFKQVICGLGLHAWHSGRIWRAP
jgi:hypothetical protein